MRYRLSFLILFVALGFLAAIFSPADAQNVVWERQFGFSGSDEAMNVSVGPGGIYIVGYTFGILAPPLPGSGGSRDMFVRLYDVSGSELWTRQFGSADPLSFDEALAVAAAQDTTVYVGGRVGGSMFGRPYAGSYDAVLMRLASNGDTVWVRQFGGTGQDRIDGVAVNGFDEVYVCGQASPGAFANKKTTVGVFDDVIGVSCSIVPDLSTLEFAVGDTVEFVNASLFSAISVQTVTEPCGTSGSVIDSRVILPRMNESIVLTADARAYEISGVGCGACTELIPVDGAFVRKYDASGQVMWTRQFGATSSDQAMSIALDPNGDVYVSGMTYGILPGQSPVGGPRDSFVAKFDPDGWRLWLQQFGTTADDYAPGVSATATHVYVSGGTTGAFPGFTNVGAWDAFVRKYNSIGSEEWTRQFGSDSFDHGMGVAADNGGVYVVGDAGAIDESFVGGLIDGFVRRYDASGNIMFTRQFGSAESDLINNVDVLGSSLYLAGYTQAITTQNPDATLDAYVVSLDAPALVDLEIVAFISPSTAVVEDNIGQSLFAVVRNNSAEDIADDFFIGVYLSADDLITTDDILLYGGRDVVNGLSAGEATVINYGTIPYDAPAGPQFLGVIVDEFDAIAEANETNNTDSRPITVTLPSGATFAWTRQFGSPGSDLGLDLSAYKGEVFLGGAAADTLLGQPHVGNDDAFIAGYNAAGAELWAREFGTELLDRCEAVVRDSLVVLVAGNTDAALPGQDQIGSRDAFIRLYEPNGTVVWTRQFGSTAADRADALARDAFGGTYVAGETSGEFPEETNSQGGTDAYVRRYHDGGAAHWTHQFGTGGYDTARGVASDGSGVYVVGWTDSILAGTANAGGMDCYIRKLDPGLGIDLWTRQFGSPADDFGYKVAVFGDVVYVYGFTDGAMPGASNLGGRDAFIIRLTTEGVLHWIRQFGTTSNDEATDIFADATGVYVTGWTQGAFRSFEPLGSTDAFFRHYSPGGQVLVSQQFGTSGQDEARGIARDDTGLYIGGFVGGALPGQSTAGGLDAFVTKVGANDVNLTIARFDVPPTAAIGEPIGDRLTIWIANTTTTPITEDFSVGLYVTTDDYVDTTGVLVGRVTVQPSLLPGGGLAGSDTLAIDFPASTALPPSSPTGEVFLGLFVDDRFQIAETSEGDNQWAAPIFVPADGDGDGVPDNVDRCPGENASFFDRDGDGCIDTFASARHIEYWSDDDFPLPYFINETGAPGITDGSDSLAIRNGIEAWEAIPAINLSTAYQGTTPQMDGQAMDGINLATFQDPDYVFPSGVLAVGLSTSFTEPTVFQERLVRPGQIVDADIIFNASMRFSTPTQGAGTSLESVAQHEAGHMFGISHSAIQTATMFYVLPPGTDAQSFELDDISVFKKAYGDSVAGEGASAIEGTIVDGLTGEPVPGAIVFAIDVITGDTTACDYTLPNGHYTFWLDPGDYYVAIHPLNGTSPIGFIQPINVNQLVLDTAVPYFVPESWDLEESATDDPAARYPIAVEPGARIVINLWTNIDDTPPTVTSVSPGGGATGVPIDDAVFVTFSEGMDNSTLVGNFAVTDTVSGAFTSGNALFVDDDSSLVFFPFGTFNYSTVYRVHLGDGLRDVSGNALADSPLDYYFTTEVAPPVGISTLSPSAGPSATLVTISGVGFNAGNTTTDNYVSFVTATDSIVATTLSVTPTQLVAAVPGGVTIGVVRVNVTTGGDVSNSLQFEITAPNEVAKGFEADVVPLGAVPRSIKLLPNGELAFVATDLGILAIDVDPGSAGYKTATPVAGVTVGTNELDAVPSGASVYAVSRLAGKLFRISANTPFQALNEIDLGAGPRGIVVEPAGRRAFIATDAGEIQIWDVKQTSATFERQVGLIIPPNPGVRGKMAITPLGDRLLTLDAAGALVVYDLGPDTLLSEVVVGLDPRDVTTDPSGQFAYVSDGNGLVSIVSLLTYTNVATVKTEGSVRGVDVTPGGAFLTAVNRELNLLHFVELRQGVQGFRTVVESLPLRMNPVDLELSPDGAFAFCLSEFERSLVITSIGAGAELQTLMPIAGPVGTKLVVAGAGFLAGSATQVEFSGVSGGPIVAAPERAADSSLTVAVPPGAASGAVVVLTTDETGVQSRSNGLAFTVLGPTGAGALRLAAQAPSVASPSFADGSSVMRVSPTGAFLLTADFDGEVHYFDIDPGSATQYQYVGSMNTVFVVEDIAMSPDGERAFLMRGTPNDIQVYNVNRLSPDFLAQVGTIYFEFLEVSNVADMQLTPDGRLLVVSDVGARQAHIIDSVDGSDTAYEIVASVSLVTESSNGLVRELAIHPGDSHAYLPVRDFGTPVILVLDIDQASATFGQIVGETVLPLEGDIPTAIDFTPQGDRCLVLAGPVEGNDRSLLTIDTSVPSSPVVASVQLLATPSLTSNEHVRVSPFGDRAVYDLAEDGLYRLDVAQTAPYPVVDGFFLGDVEAIDFAYTPLGDRIIVASAQRDSLFILDFSAAEAISITSGNNQTGVAGQPLAAPLRVRVSTTSGGSVGGVPITFSVTGGGGSLSGTETTTQTVSTDASGYAQVALRTGSSVGANTQTVSASALGLGGSPLLFTASTVPDPNTLPLELSQVIPAAGSNGVNITTAVQATLSRGVDVTSVDNTTFFLRLSGTATSVSSVIGFTDQNRKLSLTPVAALAPDTLYEVHITADVRDESGGVLQNPTTTTFRTAPAPPLVLSSVSPASGPTNVVAVLSGTGFSPTPAGNKVLFGNVSAQITEAGDDFLDVRVPLSASTSGVRVVVGADTSNAMPFAVLVPSAAPETDVFEDIGTSSRTRAVAITMDGLFAYAVSPDANSVLPVDLVSLTAESSVGVGENPYAITMHPDGSVAYVANLVDGTVNVIGVDQGSPDFNTVLDTIPVGDNPVDLVVTPDGDRLIVANYGSGDISIVDSDPLSATFHDVLATSKTGGGTSSVAITPDGARVYVGTTEGYTVLDGLNYAVVATSKTGGGTSQIAITPDGALLILLTRLGDVEIYDIAPGSPTENQVIATSRTGGGTSSIAVSPDGALLFMIQEATDEILVVSLEPLGSVSVLEPGTELPRGTIEIEVIATFSAGEDPAWIAFAPDGSGRFVVTNAGSRTISVFDRNLQPVAAAVRVTPRTLNTKSRGRYIKANIVLETGFDPQDIDISTVYLAAAGAGTDSVLADQTGWVIRAGSPANPDTLSVQFDRAAFQLVIPQGEFVPVHVSGRVGTRRFLGSDVIRTVRPVVKTPPGGTTVIGGVTTLVSWESPGGVRIDAVDVYWTPNDGADWLAIATMVPNAGSIYWRPPMEVGVACRVMVTLYRDGEDIGSGMSQDVFTLQAPVPIAMATFTAVSADRSALLQWTTAFESGFRGFNVLRSEDRDGIYDTVSDALVPAKGYTSGASYEFRDGTVRPNQTYFYKLEEVNAEGLPGEAFGPYEFTHRAQFELRQNAPNPFNPTTTIRFTIADDAFVKLDIFDVAGRRVRTLVSGDRQANYYEVVWDGKDSHGRVVASGLYFYRLEAGKFRETRKMLMLK